MEMKNYIDFKDYIDNDEIVREIDSQDLADAQFNTELGQISYNFFDLDSPRKSHILLTQIASEVFNKELIPTYVNTRKYLKGSRLYFHTDRVECEYSLTHTVKGNIPWPICIENEKIETTTGIGVFYKGIEQLHGRIGKSLEDVYCCFFHWVDKNGEYRDHAFDKVVLSERNFEEKYKNLSKELGITL